MAKAEVVLELSGIEAGVLLEILDRVRGDPDGPRAAADSIRRAIRTLGIEPVGESTGNVTLSKGK